MGQADNLLELTRLNSDVANSADFATILSRNAVSATADGLAFRGGQFSANVKSSLVILHEFGHNFGGQHSMNNKNNDPLQKDMHLVTNIMWQEINLVHICPTIII